MDCRNSAFPSMKSRALWRQSPLPDLAHVPQLGQPLDRHDEGVPFERPSVRDHLVNQRTVVVAEPAPENEVLGALDGPRWIDLDAVEMTRDFHDAVLGGRQLLVE
jgi:hypothetical protein